LNSEVDKVAQQASSNVGDKPQGMKLEVQKFPSIEEFHTL